MLWLFGNGTPLKTSSALTYSGIQHFAFTGGRIFDGTHDILAPGELIRRAKDHVFRQANIMQSGANLQLGFSLGALHRHDNQNVHITVRTGVAACMRTEENDAIRVETPDEAFHDSADLGLNLPATLRHSWPLPACLHRSTLTAYTTASPGASRRRNRQRQNLAGRRQPERERLGPERADIWPLACRLPHGYGRRACVRAAGVPAPAS